MPTPFLSQPIEMARELSHIPIQKVTAFCVREGELLVFDHPTAGTQLPAGTVDPGEDPRDAVAREFTEETGIPEPIVGRCIGVIEEQVAAHRAYLLNPALDAEGTEIPRGWPVLLDGANPGERMDIRHEVWDWDERPPRLLEQRLATAPHTSLTQRVRRHFYLLDTLEERSEPWRQSSDRSTWQVRWAPLEETLRLAGEQDRWLKILLQYLDN